MISNRCRNASAGLYASSRIRSRQRRRACSPVMAPVCRRSYSDENPSFLGLPRRGAGGSIAIMTTTTHPNSVSPVVRRPGEGEHVLQMRACVTVKLPAGATPDGRVSAAEFLMPPGFGPPLHIHHQEDEILQILDGSVRVVCGDTDDVLAAGGFAYLPRDVPHTFRVLGDG